MTTPAGRGPRVVIVDLGASDSFREFEAALRRRGVDVVRVRGPYSGRGRAAKRAVDLVVSGSSEVSTTPPDGDDAAARALRSRILAHPTVDVHAPEPLLVALAETPEWSQNGGLSKFGIDARRALDKFEVGRVALEHDVRIPDAWIGDTTDTWPVVVKGRLGAGGAGVRVVRDADELARALHDLEHDGVFLERYHPGMTLATAGVARNGELLVSGAYERISSDSDPLGPPVRIRLVDELEALEASARLIRALGYTGMWCLNFVRDPDGRPLLIDVNTRVFGSWLAMQEAGVPLLEAYMDLLGGGRAMSYIPAAAAEWTEVVRLGTIQGGSVGEVLRGSRRTARLVWSRRASLGPRWVIMTEVRVANKTARETLRAARR